jgi:hypothetical protein
MGLSIVVGALGELEDDEEGADWLRGQLALVDEVLRAHGLPGHEEPERIDARSRAEVAGFPYSWLHTLRRAYAHAVSQPSKPLRPLPPGADGGDDPALRRLQSDRTVHLIFHSDAEGFYVPVDFAKVLVDDGLPGMMLGSSSRLMVELVRMAPVLGIRLQGANLPDTEANAINEDAHDQPPFFRERTVWLNLFEAARLSLETGAAIVFQ